MVCVRGEEGLCLLYHKMQPWEYSRIMNKARASSFARLLASLRSRFSLFFRSLSVSPAGSPAGSKGGMIDYSARLRVVLDATNLSATSRRPAARPGCWLGEGHGSTGDGAARPRRYGVRGPPRQRLRPRFRGGSLVRAAAPSLELLLVCDYASTLRAQLDV